MWFHTSIGVTRDVDDRLQILLTRDQIHALRNGLKIFLTPTIACRYLDSAAQYDHFRLIAKAVNRRAGKPISKKFYFDLHLTWPQIDLLVRLHNKVATPPAPPPKPDPDRPDSLWEHLTDGEDGPRIHPADKSFNEREFLATLKEVVKQSQSS